MDFSIDSASKTPIYRQLGEQIRSAIARGRLQENTRLPSVRDLSRGLVINPNTVARVYTELEREGLLITRHGLGVYVAPPGTDLTKKARRERLTVLLDSFFTEAVLLGFTAEEVQELVQDRVAQFQWQAGVYAMSEVVIPDAIAIEHLSKSYGPKWVVRDLNLRVPTGCVYGFLGRNGAGKSTTIKMLTGMTPPDAGHVSLLGENIVGMTPATRACIAYMAEGHPLYSWMTIGQIVQFTRSFYEHWDQTLVDQILDHFELSRKQKCGRLSRGQQAQVSLALAMAPDPELLILDDPTLGLDTVVRRDFLEALIQIIQTRGRTIFFSSHVLGDVERVATRIGVMVDGVLRVDCPTETFRDSVRRVILGFGSEPPDFPGCEGLVSWRRVGLELELVVVNWGPAQQAVAETLEPRWTDVMSLNLEDAFIEYTRGSKRSLPLFHRETSRADRTVAERNA